MVVVTSVKAARRRLRYESWHLLHLYAYLGVGLALPHQLWTGQQFIGSPATHRLLVDRLGASPPARSWSGGSALPLLAQPAPPASGSPPSSPRAPASGRSTSTGRRLDRLRGRGRPVPHLALPRPARAGPAPTPTPCPPRPTDAACASPCRRRRRQRRASPACGPGTRVLVEGPYGRLSARARTRHRSPSSAPASASRRCARWPRAWPTRPARPSSLQRYTDEPLFAAELDALAPRARPPGAAAARAAAAPPTPGSADGIGAVDDLTALRHWIPDVAERDVYVCGPAAWTDLVRAHPARRRPPARPAPSRDLRLVTRHETHRPWVLSTLSARRAAVRLPHLHLRADQRTATPPAGGVRRRQLDRHAPARGRPSGSAGNGSDSGSRRLRDRHRLDHARPSPARSPRPSGDRSRSSSPSSGGTITGVARAAVPQRQRQGRGDQRLRAADPHPGDPRRAERPHRHGQRRHRDQRGYIQSLQSALDQAGL